MPGPLSLTEKVVDFFHESKEPLRALLFRGAQIRFPNRGQTGSKVFPVMPRRGRCCQQFAGASATENIREIEKTRLGRPEASCLQKLTPGLPGPIGENEELIP
jgi:hypothetical protein